MYLKNPQLASHSAVAFSVCEATCKGSLLAALLFNSVLRILARITKQQKEVEVILPGKELEGPSAPQINDIISYIGRN